MIDDISHRPWLKPNRSWIIKMVWEDLLFAHWPVNAEEITPHLPSGLTLDTFDGTAFLGIVPFRMCGTRLRGIPPVPGPSSFLELNVRTYVHHENKPGVWFFSLDASSRLAVRTARRFFHLPYFDADMHMGKCADEFAYVSRRTHRGSSAAGLDMRYRPKGNVFFSEPKSFEHWLTERYCLYSSDKKERLYCGEIHHGRWPLQKADAEFQINDMVKWLNIRLPHTQPHLLFAKRQEVVAWTLKQIT